MVEGPELKWTEGDRWHAEITLPSGSIYEYKYVLLDSSGTHALTWQRGNNSVLAIKQVSFCLAVALSRAEPITCNNMPGMLLLYTLRVMAPPYTAHVRDDRNTWHAAFATNHLLSSHSIL